MNSPIFFKVENQVALVTLNRPEKRNAINQALLAGLYDALDKIEASEQIKAAVITGNGKSFCAGIDLSVITTENVFDPREDGKLLPEVFSQVSKPLVGAINGHAITGGFEIALNCDFLIASENASFADTHTRVGIHPGWGMSQLLQQAIGQRRAKQMSFTCEFINAEKAMKWGLVNEVVPAPMLLPRAIQIAEAISKADPQIMNNVKNLIEIRNQTTLSQALDSEKKGFKDFVARQFNKS